LTTEQQTFEELDEEGTQFELQDVTQHIVDSEHKSAPESEEGYPYIKTSDIENGRINFDDVSYVNKEAYQEWTRRLTPQPGDIIFTREAPVGRVGLIPEGKEVCLGQRTVLIRPDPEKLDNQYLRYLLLSKDIQNRFNSLSTGSTVDHLNLGDLRSFELPNLPDLQEQKIIGQMLSNFDEKIETNKSILELLEDISQSIFENRFVDYEPYDRFKQTELGEIPEDFEIVEVDDLIWSGRGYSYTSDYLDKENEIEDSYPMINLKNVKEGGGFQTDGYKYYTEESIKDRYHIEKGDLVVAITEQTLDGSLIGSPSLIPRIEAEKSIISQDLAKIVPDEISKVFFYHLFNSSRFDEYTTSVATGTTVYHLSLTSIGEFKFALPPMEDINNFVDLVEDFHEMKYNIIDKISRLEDLRDTLLPKLVSGEVRVNDINLEDIEVGSEV
jgi:type I restriction enzyme S subunit